MNASPLTESQDAFITRVNPDKGAQRVLRAAFDYRNTLSFRAALNTDEAAFVEEVDRAIE